MTAVAFDTLKFARTLREKAKLSSEQAEGLADAMVEVLDGNLATRTDVREVRGEIRDVRGDIEALKIQTRADIESLRLSTKADTDALRLSTKADIEGLRLSTKADIEALRSELIKWMFGTVGLQTIVILGAVVTLA